ncbi:MAG TPA: thioredoxin family protein [Saprospiraceae bacterium]|nr:thioredoxin family protein [Saprospiraceae bacterium]HPI05513.1 thioredoxin family protein [Saprospiraceae bacterium]
MKQLLAWCAVAATLATLSFTVKNPGGYSVGDTARDFSLKNVDGKMVALADQKDVKGYIVVFTCNHCPYAMAYEDRVIALHKKYASQGFPVIAINSNDKTIAPADSYVNMQKRVKEKSIPYAYLYDETQEIAKTYGATRTPHVFVLDENRVVRYIGAIDDNSEEPSEVKEKYVENAVDALLAGKEVPVKQTKAIGCGIKWKA